ncbi:hypothetical protein [Variovorax sp. 770b2]|uniref:hypothetical protein n=1 Tax=Variovorax sp. 770b2 TaxID=1566271 RepID=UPI0015A71B33|nr:hypothetical protein [Variovorax sp. 770b2]
MPRIGCARPSLLEEFEQDITKLGDKSNFCHSSFNYSMRAEAGRALTATAR